MQTIDQPLLRLWDHYFDSRTTPEVSMTSSAPDRHLDTHDARKSSLTIHINHQDWRPTPYISFTTSPAAIRDLADMRAWSGGPHTLTVVDPRPRLTKGVPTLQVAAEMKHYNIQDPYGRQGQFHTDHYLCLGKVSADEVVGH